MQTDFAVDVLTILADPTRLRLFRLLVRRGPLGSSIDGIVSTLGLAPSALTGPLALLERAEFATSWRDGENVFYAVNLEGVRRLLAFLTADCCDSRPGLCQDVHHTADFNAPVRLVSARATRDHACTQKSGSLEMSRGAAWVLERISSPRLRTLVRASSRYWTKSLTSMRSRRNTNWTIGSARTSSREGSTPASW